MSADNPGAPIARREPTVRDLHGHEVVDDYAWMSQDRPALIRYLDDERAYYEAVTAHTAELQQTLYDEMVRRVPEADETPPWRHGAHHYNVSQLAGQQYPRFCRSNGSPEVLLDLNVLAGESAYLALGVRTLSPDGSLLAYSVDTDGDETYELRVRDLATGLDRDDVIPATYYGCAWSADSTVLLYVVTDAAHRPYRVMRHRLGTSTETDTVVVEETDERFTIDLSASRSHELIIITSASSTSTEICVLPTAEPDAEPRLVAPRQPDLQTWAEHVPGPDGGDLYLVTNDDAVEFRLMRLPVREIGTTASAVEVIATDPAVRLLTATAFADHLVMTIRRDGDQLLRVLDLVTGVWRDETAQIPAGTIRLSCIDDREEPVIDPFDATAATVVIESLIAPPSWWTIDLATGARTFLKTAATPTYDVNDYVTERVTITAPDGVEVPVTIAHRAGIARDGTAPGLLYGYGAYEICIDPVFTPALASLLDRGVVYAIAHIRGGGECGRHWWLDGKLSHKRNTFTDFIAAADGLVEQGWVDGDRIAARGGSAGGLLQGAVFAMAPSRWRVIVAEVPFVDVLTTMLDPSLPLTAGEWEEWGDPRTASGYADMAAYSPYDNVPLGDRPDLLATGSLHDPRVMVHEPAKWIAKLRATQTDDSLALLRADTGSASHSGPSGRYDRLRYSAEILAFVLDRLSSR